VITQGRVIAGEYEIIGRISEGGMATVYSARRMSDGQVLALKVLREQFAADAEFVERFQREAKAVSELSHPHMVRVFASGEDGGIHFIAMEFVEGEDLKRFLRRERRLSSSRAAEIAAQVCEALEYAHAHGIIHRDVKPQNILLTKDGDVKVADFGIARAMSAATITQTGTVLGSVQYLAPEQARGLPVGRTADVYALGVVLYEMVTGSLPFDEDSPIAIALKHMDQDPPRPSTHVPDLPPRIEGIVLRALAKAPRYRYQSADQMRWDLLGKTDLWKELPPPKRTKDDTPATLVLRPGEPAEPEERPLMVPGPVLALGLVVLVIGGIWGGWRAFSSYIAVPEVEVPNFVGRTVQAAEQAAAERRLTLRVAEEAFSTEVAAGQITSQDQPAGKPVKVGRVVNVAVSLGPEMVGVPDVQRRSLIEARLIIDRARLQIGELREAFDEDVKGGFVISQNPQPGARLERGSPIHLVVSKGPQRVLMPLLVGRSLVEARRMLQELGVTLSAVKTVPTADMNPETVVDQSPSPGTRIRAQDAVTVTVTVRPGQETTPPPSPVVTAQPQRAPSREEKLTRVQLVVPGGEQEQAVKIVVIDERGVQTVFQKTLAPGDRVDERIRSRGFTIIQVFIQNQLVQEIRP
jgi:beta-lactam-binding protein with PASTA domain/predicted Ser/Thr protein kinase